MSNIDLKYQNKTIEVIQKLHKIGTSYILIELMNLIASFCKSFF